MDTKRRGDLVINGFGTSNGGPFHHVNLNGFGTVNNDIECAEFECNGVGTVNGNVTAESGRINGKGKINGNFESKRLTIDGTAKVGKDLVVEKLKISGKASVGGKVKSDELNIRGRITVEEDCEAEIFKTEGQFTIGGLLNADQIDIKLFGECKSKEIGGQTIVVKYKSSMFSLLNPLFPTQLITELIEGDKIELENTKAAIVRGNHITIGPNCEIGLVEYTGELSIHHKASVKENRKL